MFSGLSAFPLTPIAETGIEETALIRLIERLAQARVDSIGALGSTGSYAYLSRAERLRAVQLAVEHADGIPVIVGIGALRTRDVLALAQDAQAARVGFGALGLNAGCEAWYSVIGGQFPQLALEITRAAQAGNPQEATRWSDRLAPLWALFSQCGSLRVTAAAAELSGLVRQPCLPLPLRSLEGQARLALQAALDRLRR